MPVRDETAPTSIFYGVAQLPSVPVLTRHYSQWKTGTYQYISALNHVKPHPPFGKGFYANSVNLSKSSSSGGGYSSWDFVQVFGGVYKYRIILNGDFAACLSDMVVGYPYLPTSGYSSGSSGSLMDASISKAYAKLTEPDFDLGVTIGELRETLSGLANPLSALRKYIEQMKRLNGTTLKAWQANRLALVKRQRGAYTLSALGGSWLEWRMGIRPLIKTIEDLLKHLRDANVRSIGQMQRVRGTVRATSNTNQNLQRVFPSFTVNGNASVSVKQRCTTAIYYIQDAPLTFDETYGIDIGSLPAVLWELTRLSFVVDRFIRVGEFLQGLRLAAQGKRTILGTVTSLKTNVDVQTSVTDIDCRFINRVSLPCGQTYSMSQEHLSRVVNRTKPVLPALNQSNLKIQQQLDHISLIWQALPSANWREQRTIANRADRELRKIANLR